MEEYIIIEHQKRRMQCKNLAEVEKKGNYHNFEENCTDLFCKAKKNDIKWHLLQWLQVWNPAISGD